MTDFATLAGQGRWPGALLVEVDLGDLALPALVVPGLSAAPDTSPFAIAVRSASSGLVMLVEVDLGVLAPLAWSPPGAPAALDGSAFDRLVRAPTAARVLLVEVDLAAPAEGNELWGAGTALMLTGWDLLGPPAWDQWGA